MFVQFIRLFNNVNVNFDTMVIKKDKAVPLHAMKTLWVTGGIAPTFF
jgi:hypothetical protein